VSGNTLIKPQSVNVVLIMVSLLSLRSLEAIAQLFIRHGPKVVLGLVEGSVVVSGSGVGGLLRLYYSNKLDP
jgi:hypothetical protein